jgi:hypothetical protein
MGSLAFPESRRQPVVGAALQGRKRCSRRRGQEKRKENGKGNRNVGERGKGSRSEMGLIGWLGWAGSAVVLCPVRASFLSSSFVET